MEAILIDRNFEFLPANGDAIVKASIGIICATEVELLFLLDHLNTYNLSQEYKESLQKKTIQPLNGQSKLKLKQKDEKPICFGTIDSLEL